MSARSDVVSASKRYGETRGLTAYHLYLAEKPEHQDRRVDDIAKAAVELAMLADSRYDLIPNYVVVATLQALDSETLGLHPVNTEGADEAG